MDNKEFKRDICCEFDCTRDYCKEREGYDCLGEFWEDKCIFYGEHRYLNLNLEHKNGG